jgi:pilus assembly protein Flp/PilA
MKYKLGRASPAFLSSFVKEELMFLKRVMNKAVDFLKSEDGPTAVEYAVMLALIIIVCLAAIQIIGRNANSAFGTVGASIGATVSAS